MLLMSVNKRDTKYSGGKIVCHFLGRTWKDFRWAFEVQILNGNQLMRYVAVRIGSPQYYSGTWF